MARGNARLPIFEDDNDRKRFLSLLEAASKRFNLAIHAYCLMDNHYHLVVETPDANLSAAMRHINGVYTQSFNRRHGRSGHVFQGRYKALVVEAEAYLAELSRYVVLNPVRAGIAETAEQYPWSSFRQTAGQSTAHQWLSTSALLSRFGVTRQEALAEYRRFVNEADCEDVSDKISGGLLLGSESFKDLISGRLLASQSITEIPKSARFANRPPLEELVPKGGFSNKQERDKAILVASQEYGYSYTSIGEAFSLHYSSVSVIIKKANLKTL